MPVQKFSFMKKVKKLSLKKVKILDFDDARRIVGGTVGEGCPYTTEADNCSSKAGRPDSCTECLTNENTCPETCFLTCNQCPPSV